jgi:hypothetical protein
LLRGHSVIEPMAGVVVVVLFPGTTARAAQTTAQLCQIAAGQ